MAMANHFFSLAKKENSELDINKLGIILEKEKIKQSEK